MKNLLNFLFKYAHVIFFILLQSVSVTLIIIYNNYHKSVFISSSNNVSGFVFKKQAEISAFLYLREQNDSLVEENLRLRNTLELYRQEKQISTDLISYKNIAATVINAQTNATRNFFTLNKGSGHGISEEMGVISANGVVGITYLCSNNFSTVLPLIHVSSRLSVKIKKNDYFGSLAWNGNNVRIAQMYEIPGYVDIEIGDEIVTSGFSAYFPEGIPVGRINAFQLDKATDFYEIEVELFTDFNKVNHVYIIENINFLEQRELELMHND
jgi:rod shape-determining protein MreC